MSRDIKISPQLAADAVAAGGEYNERVGQRASLAMSIGSLFLGLVESTIDLDRRIEAAKEKVNATQKAIRDAYGATEEDVEKLDLQAAVLTVKQG